MWPASPNRDSVISSGGNTMYPEFRCATSEKEHAVVNCRSWFLIFMLANGPGWPAPAAAADRQSCPVTGPFDPPFVPPKPYSPAVGRDEFSLRVAQRSGRLSILTGTCTAAQVALLSAGLRLDERRTPTINGCGSTTGWRRATGLEWRAAFYRGQRFGGDVDGDRHRYSVTWLLGDRCSIR
jgi:hypothetical protein